MSQDGRKTWKPQIVLIWQLLKFHLKPEKAEESQPVVEPGVQEVFVRAQRRRLPDERKSITHKFSIAGHEIFIKIAKEGSTLSCIMGGLALSLSIGLQYGVPLKALVDKLTNTRFEPSGFTENPNIRYANSVLDYIARWLGEKVLSRGYLKPRCALSDQDAVHSVRSSAVINSAQPEPI